MKKRRQIWMLGFAFFLLNFFLILNIAFAHDCYRDPLNAND